MTMNQPTDEQGIQRAFAGAIHEHWQLFLFEGIVLALLGVAAIVVPPIATLAFELIIGWLFLISGIVWLVHGHDLLPGLAQPSLTICGGLAASINERSTGICDFERASLA